MTQQTNNNDELITPGKYVELGYDLYVINPQGDETLVHQTDKNDPERLVYGVTEGVIEPLAAAIENMKAGDAFDVKVSADQAFGPRSDEQIVDLERDIFMVDGKFDEKNIRPGSVLPMMTAEGFRINGIVLEVTDKSVKMDFNHPLAGKDLHFKGSITLVREATPEDIHPAGCGCNGGCGDGCGDSCGDKGSCGCGDGCCH